MAITHPLPCLNVLVVKRLNVLVVKRLTVVVVKRTNMYAQDMTTT
jgi:hypothetical protein